MGVQQMTEPATVSTLENCKGWIVFMKHHGLYCVSQLSQRSSGLLLMFGFAGCFFMIFRGDAEAENDQFSTIALSLCRCLELV